MTRRKKKVDPFVAFIRRQAREWKRTEKTLRRLGYGPALDHDKALLWHLGRGS